MCSGVWNLRFDTNVCLDMQALVASLGEHMSSVDGTSAPVALHDTTPPELTGLPVGIISFVGVFLTYWQSPTTRKRALTNSSALADVLNEFVSTERSYVKRLRILKEVRTIMMPTNDLKDCVVLCGPVAHLRSHQRHGALTCI